MAYVDRSGNVPSAFWPAALAVLCLALWYTVPWMVTSVTAGIAAVLVLSLGFLSPVFGLVALLVITPFQPFIDFYAPSLGSVYAGAALRDGLLVVISLRWILSRWFSEAAPQLTIPEKVALLYLILAIVWIPIAPSFAGALVGYRNMVGFIVLLFVAAKAMSVRDRSAVLLKCFSSLPSVRPW